MVPFISYLQCVVDHWHIPAPHDEVTELQQLLNPVGSVSETEHWVAVGNELATWALIAEAIECFDRALAMERRHHSALSGKAEALRNIGEHEQARQLMLLVSQKDGKFARDDMATAYTLREGGFFETAWHESELGGPFVKWASKNYSQLEIPTDDVWAAERLIRDETDGGPVADFVNGLPKRQRTMAIESIVADLRSILPAAVLRQEAVAGLLGRLSGMAPES